MDDDDEFGDLYTDVLRPFSATPPPSPPPATTTIQPTTDLNPQSDEEDFLFEAPDPKFTTKPTHQTPVLDPSPNQEPIVNEIEIKINPPPTTSTTTLEQDSARVSETRVLEEVVKNGDKEETRVLEEKGGIFVKDDERLEIEDLDSEPMIPGLSGSNFTDFNGGNDVGEEGFDGGNDDVKDGGGGEDDDWDSDSEDDLQIVLNDKNGGPMGMMDGNGRLGSDDDDDEDGLVIVADGGGQIHHQPIEEQEWGEDMMQVPDGERKESGDAAKANGAVGNAVGARIGYSSHVYPPHHSQFKYVRPGTAMVPGGAIVGPGGPPGQVRPVASMGPIAGRGRGDWRPVGVRPGLPMQRPFGSGFGQPAWGNNPAGRGFGNGLDFTLPSHKTIFEYHIDTFEDKPWTHHGVDTSDFFNFGLNADTWKEYCKQLEQLRLEATMQSKIRVYESGRSEQDYDPDLPPELAAASVMHEASIGNAPGITDGGQTDVMGEGRGIQHARPPIPTGRAIQVEGGFGERLPSIDTRPPRMRDSDSIIEIVLQDSTDDDPVTAKDGIEQADNDVQRDDVKGRGNEEDIGQTDYDDRFPQIYDGRKKEMVGQRDLFVGSIHGDIPEGDENLPFHPEAPVQYNSGSKGRTSSYTQDRRWRRGTSRDRYSNSIAGNDNHAIPCQNTQVDEVRDSQREKSGESVDGEPNLDSSSLAAVEDATDPSAEHMIDVQNELELADSSVLVEKEKAVDMTIPSETVGDGSPLHSVKKKKLSSRVEQLSGQDIGSGDDLRAAQSSDNSKARSGSSRDYQKRRDGVREEEVVQEWRSRKVGDLKRHRDEDERGFQRKEDYNRDGRQEMDRNRMFMKGRDDSHLSYPYRERDLSSTHLPRVKPGDMERSRERDNSVGARLRREDDTHVRRVKDDETRKRERVEEVGSRQRSKVRESERGEKDEHFHSKKRMENGDWRSHHDKDVGPRQREDILSSRHESFDDSHAKRRKDEEYQRREQAEKEILHGYRAKEDTSRRKRERDESLELRRREDQPRVREKPDDTHSVRHREENWRQRERDDRRLKQPHEDMQSTRDREGRVVVRSGRDLEEKPWVGSSRSKDESKGMGSDKEYPFKDKRRQNEQSKRNDRAEDDYFSQHRGRDTVYARENQFGYEDRNPRHERSSSHNDRLLNASDSQLMPKERHRDNRRNKESEGGDQDTLVSSKRKQDDYSAHRSEKVGMKIASEQVGGNVTASGLSNTRDPGQSRLSSGSVSKKNLRENDVLQQRHSSRKHREDVPSDDEQNSRKGRSKLERWTSHKDRDENAKTVSTSSLKAKEIVRCNTDQSSLASERPDEQSIIIEPVNGQHPMGEDGNAYDSETKDGDIEPTSGSRQIESDKVEEDRHLDTVAKLKKRSERFKTPMPPEKDATTNKKMDNEALASVPSETAIDAEVKAERPARKRRWISS